MHPQIENIQNSILVSVRRIDDVAHSLPEQPRQVRDDGSQKQELGPVEIIPPRVILLISKHQPSSNAQYQWKDEPAILVIAQMAVVIHYRELCVYVEFIIRVLLD